MDELCTIIKKNGGLPSPPQNVTILRNRVFTEATVRAGRSKTSIASIPKAEERDRQVSQSTVMKTTEDQRGSNRMARGVCPCHRTPKAGRHKRTPSKGPP